MGALHVTKAHAYGNDFLLVPSAAAAADDPGDLAQALCDRHSGLGGDGLILYDVRRGGASMRLINADGSPAELSGNGARCLAALVAREQHLAAPGPIVTIETEAGSKVLTLLASDEGRLSFRAAMGHPGGLREVVLNVGGENLRVSVMSMGNPQCVALMAAVDQAALHRLGPSLSSHSFFPAGTNVELAVVEAPDRVRILIWERGVGPTSASGTGACAAAVAACAHGGAGRDVRVESPGGTQHVEWREDGVYLTGWAELLLDGAWQSPRRRPPAQRDLGVSVARVPPARPVHRRGE